MVQVAPSSKSKTTGAATREATTTGVAPPDPTKVFGLGDERIGELVAYQPDPKSGKPIFFVVETGGFLGMGATLHKVEADKLRIDNENRLRLLSTKDQLKAMPEFKYEPGSTKVP
jgi:hypothetical protein